MTWRIIIPVLKFEFWKIQDGVRRPSSQVSADTDAPCDKTPDFPSALYTESDAECDQQVTVVDRLDNIWPGHIHCRRQVLSITDRRLVFVALGDGRCLILRCFVTAHRCQKLTRNAWQNLACSPRGITVWPLEIVAKQN